MDIDESAGVGNMEHRGGLVPHADDEGLWMCWSFDPNHSLAQGRARPGAGPCPDVPGPGLGPGPARPVRKEHCKSVSDCKFSLANGYCSYDACKRGLWLCISYYSRILKNSHEILLDFFNRKWFIEHFFREFGLFKRVFMIFVTRTTKRRPFSHA